VSHKVGGGEWVWIFEAKVWMFVACTLTLLSQTWLNNKEVFQQVRTFSVCTKNVALLTSCRSYPKNERENENVSDFPLLFQTPRLK